MQRWLGRARRKVISKMEQNRESRVIVLLHRQEVLSLMGFPFFRFITIEDSEQVIRAIYMTDEETPIDLVLHTPGGLVLAASQIAKALKRHKAKVTVFVPHYAMSGGTLIALAADEIVMYENAVLGPVDPQIERYPAASILRAIERKPLHRVEDKTLILGDMAEKASAQLKNLVTELLRERMGEEKAAQLADKLSKGTWTHDYGIGYEEAQSFELPITTEMPEEMMSLMQLYPQPTRKLPSVEYVPYRREPEKPDKDEN